MRYLRGVTKLAVVALVLATALISVEGAVAAPAKGSVTGTWKGAIAESGGSVYAFSMALKQSGSAVKGTITFPDGSSETGTGTLKGDKINLTFGNSRFGTLLKGTVVFRKPYSMGGTGYRCVEKCVQITWKASE